MPGQARNYCFTWNNYTDEDIKRIEQSAKCSWFKYVIFGKEIGEQGTPHLQGYLQLTTKKSIRQLKKAYGDKQHWEVARGSLEDNQYYCDKDKQYFEYGTPKATAAKRGGEPWEAVRQMIKDAEDYDVIYSEIADAYPNMAGRYYNAILKWITMAKEEKVKKMNKAEFETAILREWQIECIAKLEAQSNRQLLWIYDAEGNTGKTWLAKYLHFIKGAFYFENAKKADIACAWNMEEYAVCNLTRDKEGCVQYNVFESLKDGMLFSGKYESKIKVAAKPCKLVVMANWVPEIKTMSTDRWQIMQLDGDNWNHWTLTDVKNLKHVQENYFENELIEQTNELLKSTKAVKRQLNEALGMVGQPPNKKPRLERLNCQV